MNKYISTLIDEKLYISLFFILIGIIISGLLDLISIASIPIFINLVVQPDMFYENVSRYINSELFIKLKYEELILYLSGILLLLFFIKSIFQIYVVYLENLFLLSFTTNTGSKIFKNILNQNYKYHTKINKSVLLNTLSTELDRTRFYLHALINVIKEGAIMIIFISFLIYWIGFYIPFLVLSLLGCVGYLVYNFTRKNIQTRGEIALKFREQQNRAVSQSLNSIKEVIIYNSHSYFLKMFNKFLKGNQIQLIYNAVYNQLPKPILELTSLFIILSIVGYYVKINNSENILIVISLLAVSLIRLLPAVNTMTAALLNMKFNTASVKIIYNQVANIKNEIKSNQMFFENFNKIKFNDVNFSYNENKNLINNVNLEIISNSTIAIVGTSGSGKTTLINLLLGFYKPDSGNITLDDVNINKKNRNWSNLISYVPQQVYLIDESIKRNIAFAKNDEDIDIKKLDKVIKTAQLDQFINSLDNGYNTILGENGVNISGGQIQRIGIARALYRQPKLLILDEATSALDIDTEESLMNNLLESEENYTLLCITHRLHAIKKFKKIYKIHNNKLEILDK